jgi:hypothetical protein
VQREVGEEDVEVGEVREDEREFETACEAAVEKDNGCRLVVVK